MSSDHSAPSTSAGLSFDSVEDHLLAMLFAHLPGKDVARLACVCSHWRQVVQGVGSDENIWSALLRRDFAPYVLDSPASTPCPAVGGARSMYSHMAVVDSLCSPSWKAVYPTNWRRTVMARQGSCATVLNGCPIVYGGWTSGWDTIRNDVHALRAKDDVEVNGRKQLEWEALACQGPPPPPSYGPAATSILHPVHGPCLAVFGGVLYGGYQGPVNELRFLIPPPSEFATPESVAEGGAEAQEQACAGAGGSGRASLKDPLPDSVAADGVPEAHCTSAKNGRTKKRWTWIDPEQRSELAGGEKGSARAYHSFTMLPAGLGGFQCPRLLVFGGFADGSPLSALEMVQPKACRSKDEVVWEWSEMLTVGTPPCARFGHSASLCGPDNARLFIIGGCTGGHNHKGRGTDGDELRDVWVLSLDTEVPVWSQPDISGGLPSFAIARCHSAAVVASHIVCFGGGPSYRLTNQVVALDTRNMRWVDISGKMAKPDGDGDASKSKVGQGEDSASDADDESPAAPPAVRQNAIFVPLSGGGEIFLFGGWNGGEMGDSFLLRFGARDSLEPSHSDHLQPSPSASLACQESMLYPWSAHARMPGSNSSCASSVEEGQDDEWDNERQVSDVQQALLQQLMAYASTGQALPFGMQGLHGLLAQVGTCLTWLSCSHAMLPPLSLVAGNTACST